MDHVLVEPPGRPRCGVLVLSGSSGRIEEARVRLLAAHGAVALSMRWFGDTGQPPGICEVPLETFTPALDRLATLSDHLAVIGTSKGAEAALLLAVRDPRIRAVAAFSPSPVVWANIGPGHDGAERPQRSCWTAGGVPLPFVPYDDGWTPPPGDGPIAFRGLYEQSLAAGAEIPVERIAGRVLVTGGTDDQVWPSDRFAVAVAERRARFGLATDVLVGEGAGHRVVLPGETAPPTAGARMAYGGTPDADDALGRRVWPVLQNLLDGAARRAR